MTIRSKFSQPPVPTFIGASLVTMVADTRGGLTPEVRSNLQTMVDLAADGKASSPGRVEGYVKKIIAAAGGTDSAAIFKPSAKMVSPFG
jgi:hypothetical protein